MNLPTDDAAAPLPGPMLTCVYCDRPGPFDNEHVLARAFAGPGEDWVLTDLVCKRCNKLFSTYERAWTGAPGEAAARIHWGPAGRERKGNAYQVHPSENVFLLIKSDPVSYECDVLRGFAPRLRPQMISTSNALVTVAGASEDVPRLDAAAKAFWQTREITIQKRANPGPSQFRIATLAVDNEFRFERIELRPKPAAAWLDWFPDRMRIASDPRMSVDAHGRLRFRVSKLRQLTGLLNRALQEPCVSRPGGTIQASDLKIAIRSTYDVLAVNRAVAKTVVNYAIDAFGPGWIRNSAFRPILDFCLGRAGDLPGAPFVGSIEQAGIGAIDACPPQRHALALCSNGSRVIGLVRLYGGVIYRVHLGQVSNGFEPFERSVWIDYNGPGRVSVTP